MKPVLVVLTLAAAAALAACDRPPQPKTGAPATTAPSSAPSTAPSTGAGSGSSIPTTPAPQSGAPSTPEKKEGSNPVQGQVDPKASEQHKDFQQKGDAAGPQSAETAPKSN